MSTGPGRRTGRRPPGAGGPGRLGCGRPGGEVSGDCGQLRVGPRRERLAYPQIEFVPGQHALRERGLESAGHLLALGVRDPQVSAACRGRCQLISRPCHRRRPPPSQSRGSVVRCPSWRHPRRCQDRGARADAAAGEAITARRREPRRAVPAGQHDGGEGGTARLRVARRVSVLDPALVRAAARRAPGGPRAAGWHGRRASAAQPAAGPGMDSPVRHPVQRVSAPANGSAAQRLARLASRVGADTLEDYWRRVTGAAPRSRPRLH
jgi:hypothetical protein